MTNPLPPAQRWRMTLRTMLLQSLKARDAGRISVLRTALAAIDNAETPDIAMGTCATEVPRRVLTDDEIRRLLRHEIDERREAADQCEAAGHGDRSRALRAEVAVLIGLLDDGVVTS